MTHPTGIDLLNTYLKNCLPQEWLICISDHTTCEETHIYIRIDSETKPENGRDLVCLIQIKPNQIIIRTPDIQRIMVQKVTQMVKLYCTSSENYCFTLTECPLNCEKCNQAWSKFHE